MAIASINFYQEYNFKVLCSLNGHGFSGTLIFGKGGTPHLNLNGYSKELVTALEEIDLNNSITCKDEESGVNLVMHRSVVSGQTVFSDYVSLGNSDDGFDKIEILYTGMSTWCERINPFEIDGDVLKCNISIDNFDEFFVFRNNTYSIANDQRINITNENSMKTSIITEHTITLKKDGGVFELDEAKDLIHEVRNLFSLLMGVAISIETIHTYMSVSPGKFKRLYFPTVLHSLTPLEQRHYSLASFNEIHNDEFWNVIFSNYFLKDTFREIWNRLPTSFDYKGIWEYQILSRAIVLEKYAGAIAKGGKKKMISPTFSALKENLKKSLEGFEANATFKENDSEVFSSIKKYVLDVGNTSMQTLQDKYDYLMGTLSDDIREILSFSEDDFKLIKQLRNDTAHGNEYINHSGTNDITHEMMISDRLLILLMCFAYLDLGFSEKQILSFISNSFCSLLRNANINKRALDKFNDDAKFIKISPCVDDSLLKNAIYLAIAYNKQTGVYSFDEGLSDKIKSALLNGKLKDLIAFIKETIDYECNIEVLNKVYINNGDVELLYHAVVLITL